MAFFFSAGGGGGLASSKRHLVEHVGLVERIMELVGDLLASATRCYPPSYRSRCNRAICPERGSPPSTRSCCARGAHHVCYASSARLSPRRSPRGLRADGLLHGRRFAGATPGSSLVNVNTALRVLRSSRLGIRSRLGMRFRAEAPQRLHVVARLEGLAPLGENLPQMGYPRAPFRSLGPVDVRCDVERPLVKLLIEVAPASAESRHVVEVHVADGVVRGGAAARGCW